MTSLKNGKNTKRFETARTNDSRLSKDAKQNRQLLIKAMTSAGFTNYPGEWWHWSYGDSCWALRTGRKVAIYGMVDSTLSRAKQ